MDKNIINEDELYGKNESSSEYKSSNSDIDELDSLLSDSSTSLQIITADRLQNEGSFELDESGKWKKKMRSSSFQTLLADLCRQKFKTGVLSQDGGEAAGKNLAVKPVQGIKPD